MSDKYTHIPLSEPLISGNEWKYVKDCLDTGWVSSVGDYVNKFEEMVAEYTGSKYAIAIVNGTSALHISLIACGVSFDDEVIVPALTFIAPVNTVKYCGAEPIFMDCSSDTLCLDVSKVEEFLDKYSVKKDNGYTYNNKSGKRIKAIIPVHVFGHPTEMDELTRICSSYNIDIIEDATESLGSIYKRKHTGTFGRIGCFSFNGNKIITTGGGGMIVTDEEDLASRIRHLSTQARCNTFEYDHDNIGYNYRLTNVQAAIGVAQMERIDEYIGIKRKNAELYSNMLSGIDNIEFLWEQPWVKSNFWFYTVKVLQDHKQSLMNWLLEKNIQIRPIWKIINTFPMYSKCQAFQVEKAYIEYDRCFNIPCSLSLNLKEMEYITNNIEEYFILQRK